MTDTIMAIVDPFDFTKHRKNKEKDKEEEQQKEIDRLESEKQKIIADQEAGRENARDRYRSGTRFTNSLGEEDTAADGTRLV